MPGATISVFLAGTSTAAGVYTSLTSDTSVNSVTAAADGTFELWVSRFNYDANQKFKMILSKTGYTSVTFDNVAVDSVVLGNYTISVPTTVTTVLSVPKGVIYVKSGTGSLTINGPFEAGLYQVFSGFAAQEVVFGNGTITAVSPTWFGFAYGTNDAAQATINLAAINKASSSLSPFDADTNSRGGVVQFPAGTFVVDPGITPDRKQVEYRGASSGYTYYYGVNAGKPGTTLVFTAGVAGFDFTPLSQDVASIKNLKIDGNNVLRYGIKLSGYHIIEEIAVARCASSGIYISNLGNSTHMSKVSLHDNAQYGLLIEGTSTTTNSFSKINAHNNTLGGVKIAGGTFITFENSVFEHNGGPGLIIYRPTGQNCNYLTFKNVWFEDNDVSGGYQITINAQTTTSRWTVPNYIRFENCMINPIAPQLGIHIINAANVRFVNTFADPTDAGYYLEAGALDVSWEPVRAYGLYSSAGNVATVGAYGGLTSVTGFTLYTEEASKTYSANIFAVADTSKNTIIFEQPAHSLLVGVRVFLDAQFVAPGLTSLVLTIGDAGDNDGILTVTDNLVSSAVQSRYVTRGALWNGTGGVTEIYQAAAAKDWYVYVTSIGANLNTMTAGYLTFLFTYRSLYH